MEQEKLNILAANIRKQQKYIEDIYRLIATRKRGYTKDRVVLESLAYQLHNLYCAFEDLFKIIADYFENHFMESAWHKELLDRMALEIKDIRPRFLSEYAYELLNELRRFRHVFRHAYGFELEADKIKLVLKKTLALKKIYQKDIDDFLAQLKPTTKK
jgi:hypothetical protein